jgi:hypothetical protein
MTTTRRGVLTAAAALFFSLAIFSSAPKATTYTDTLVHATTWGTQDFWKLYAYDGANGSGNLLDGPRTFTYTQMQGYFDASVNKYRVPLTVFTNTTPGAIVSVKSQHINFTVGRSELTIEILD